MTSPLRTLLLIADVLTALHLLAGGASGQVYRVRVPDSQGTNYGSCVCIGRYDGGRWAFLTNGHVAGHLGRADVDLDGWYRGETVARQENDRTDLALVVVRYSGHVDATTLADSDPSPGTSVIVEGYPYAGRLRRRRARVLSDEKWRNVDLVVSGMARDGESGGGIMRSGDGRLIGVLWGGGHETMANGPDTIRAFLDRGNNGGKVRLISHTKPADPGKRAWLCMVSAPWCSHCRPFRRHYNDGQSNFGRLLLSRYKTVRILNYDSPATKRWLADQGTHIKALPTFVDSTGNVVRGYRGQQWLLSKLDIRATDVESPGSCDSPAPEPPKTKPEPRIQPTTPVADRDCCDCDTGDSCDCDLTALADSIKKNRELIRTLEKQPGPQGPPGERGPRGPQGERGPAGPPGADGKSVDKSAVIAELTAYIDSKYGDRDGYDDSELRAAIARLEKRINDLAAREPESGTVTIVIREDGEELYRLEGVKMGSRVDVPIERYVEEDK